MTVTVKAFDHQVFSATEPPKTIRVEGECELLKVSQDGSVLVEFQGHRIWITVKQTLAPPDIQEALWVVFGWDGRDLYHPRLRMIWEPEAGSSPYKLAAEILGAYIANGNPPKTTDHPVVRRRRTGPNA